MTGTQRQPKTVILLLALSGLLVCALASYVVLSVGLVDDVILAQDRNDVLERVEAASSSGPPNIEYLTDVVNGSDWYAAAVAAERIGLLWKSNRLDPGQADVALHSLFKALASGGHWWRFGWDKEEPEFEQFRGATIQTVAEFGSKAFPMLSVATDSDSPSAREAACWIALSMVKSDSTDQDALVAEGIPHRIENLAHNDPNDNVRAACISAQNSIKVQLP
jgi:hypothetical protein